MKESLGVYDYWPYKDRPKIQWPNGAKVALWVAPNIEFYELDPPDNPHRKAWPQPSPAVPGYSIRDYGNRVGHRRQMDLLDKYGIRGSVSLSVALCEHHPEIIDMCCERDWELFSHGIYNTRYTYGLSEEQERDMIRDSIETIYRHSGQKCAGYLAPALSHSERTLDLFSEVGSELFGDEAGIYTCDLFHDDQPTPIMVRNKKRFISMPYSLEMNDTIVYAVNKVEPRHYGTMLKRHFDRLYEEGKESGTVMCIPTHNYQVSCPHRLKAFEEALEYITGHSDVWVATGREIADYYLKHYYDAALVDIETKKGEHKMSLDNYLEYPQRSYGPDHDRFSWSMLADRAPIKWPDEKRVAVWINTSLQFYPLNQRGKPFKVPNGMAMPYPDLRHFSLRDYGNRVGIYRCLKAFERYGVRPTFAINSQLAQDTPYLLEQLKQFDAEFICHGWNMDHLHYGGQDEQEESELVKRSVDTLNALIGKPVRGWLSPAKNQSWKTPDLLAANGIEYCCDWVNDDMPYRFDTENGPLTMMPLSTELEDQFIIGQNFHSEDSWVEQIKDAFDFLLKESATQGGRMLALNIHPWMMGQPHRISSLEAVLEYIMGHAEVWQATAGEILQAFNAQTQKKD